MENQAAAPAMHPEVPARLVSRSLTHCFASEISARYIPRDTQSAACRVCFRLQVALLITDSRTEWPQSEEWHQAETQASLRSSACIMEFMLFSSLNGLVKRRSLPKTRRA
jgi:hypothetical protein